MFREITKAAQESGPVGEFVSWLFASAMGEGGSTVSQAVTGAQKVETAATVALATHRASLPGMTSYSALDHLAKSDLIAQSVKRIGSDQFSISEYTRLAHAEKLASPVVGAGEHFSMSEVQRLVQAAQERGYAGFQVPGDHGADINLSEAGARVYLSAIPMEKFIHELSQGIKDNRWSAVIGDDVSGRVPSMMVWDQMQRWAHHRNAEAPQMFFMASGRSGVGEGFSPEDRIKNLARRMEEEGLNSHSGRAVVVSEIVASGRSLEQFMRALEKHNIPYDVAAMETGKTEATLQSQLQASKDVKLFAGSSYGSLYAHGAGTESEFRNSIGVEKYGAEATSRPNLKHPGAVDLFRKELTPLGRYTFEKVFQ